MRAWPGSAPASGARRSSGRRSDRIDRHGGGAAAVDLGPVAVEPVELDVAVDFEQATASAATAARASGVTRRTSITTHTRRPVPCIPVAYARRG